MITRRGKRVRAVASALLIVASFYISGHINWVGDGWCWGTITECYFTEGKGK
jgi:hypothetical protein